jgi:hypothetical protein
MRRAAEVGLEAGMVTDDAEPSAMVDAVEVGMVEGVTVWRGMVERGMWAQHVECIILRQLSRPQRLVQRTIGERSSNADIRKFATKGFTNRSHSVESGSDPLESFDFQDCFAEQDLKLSGREFS